MPETGSKAGGPWVVINSAGLVLRHRWRGACGRIEELDAAGFGGLLENAVQRRRGILRPGPRAAKRGRLRPGAVDPQKKRPARLIHQKKGLGVDRAQQRGAGNGAQGGLAIHQNQNSRRLAEENFWRRIFNRHGFGTGPLGACHGEVCLHGRQREALRPRGRLRDHQGGVGLRTLGSRREIRPRDIEVRKRDGLLLVIHIGRSGNSNRAE